MDNASKALVIVGGILISVMIISLAMFVLASARGVSKASEERVTASQKLAFNRFFEYYGSTIEAIDAYNILGKIDDIRNDAYAIGKVSLTVDSVEITDIDETHEWVEIKVDSSGKQKIEPITYSYSYFDYNNDGIIDTVSIR